MDDADKIEEFALRALFQTAQHSCGHDLGLEVHEIDGVRCYCAARDPSILLNRAFGLSWEGPESTDRLRRVRAWYLARGIEQVYVHGPDAREPQGLAAAMAGAGFRRSRAWMKFTRGAEPIAAPASSLTVRRVGPAYALDFARILAPAFDLSAPYQALLMELFHTPGWHLYMSFDGEHAAGTGGLFVKGAVGYLDWGSTHPDCRRRGSQSALLAARIRDAIAMGCTTLLTMTGEAVPGDPQHSYHNILKCGFREHHLRSNWTLAEELSVTG